MSALSPVPGVHFWWCRSVLRPHDPRCSCPPEQLVAAVDREREAADRAKAEAIQVAIVTSAEAK